MEPLRRWKRCPSRWLPEKSLDFLDLTGAGKSTTMKLITGYQRPDGGTAIVGEYDIREGAQTGMFETSCASCSNRPPANRN